MFIVSRLLLPLYFICQLPFWTNKYPSMCVHTSHRSYICPPFTLHPWQKMHMHPWCNSWHFCCHYTRCWLPCGTKTITHTSLLTTFHFFHWQVDIMFTKDGIRFLTNVVIANPTWADLLHQCCTTWGFVASKTTKAKKKSYHDQHPIDHFIPLAIEVFGFLNKQVDVFLHKCANAMWNFKGP